MKISRHKRTSTLWKWFVLLHWYHFSNIPPAWVLVLSCVGPICNDIWRIAIRCIIGELVKYFLSTYITQEMILVWKFIERYEYRTYYLLSNWDKYFKDPPGGYQKLNTSTWTTKMRRKLLSSIRCWSLNDTKVLVGGGRVLSILFDTYEDFEFQSSSFQVNRVLTECRISLWCAPFFNFEI